MGGKSKHPKHGPHVKRDREVFNQHVVLLTAWVEEHKRLPKKHKVDSEELKVANILGQWQQRSRNKALDAEEFAQLEKIPFMQERMALWARPALASWDESLEVLSCWATMHDRLPKRLGIFRRLGAAGLLGLSPEQLEEHKSAEFLQYVQTQYTKQGNRKLTDAQLEKVKAVPHIGLRLWSWEMTKMSRCDEFVVDEYDEKDPLLQDQKEMFRRKEMRKNRSRLGGAFIGEEKTKTRRDVQKKSLRCSRPSLRNSMPAEDPTEVAKQLAAIFMSSQGAEELAEDGARERSRSASPASSSSSSSSARSAPAEPGGELQEEAVERAAENIAMLVQALCGRCAAWDAAEQKLDWLWESGAWRVDRAGRRAVLVSGKAVAAEDLREAERQCRRHFGVPWENVPRLQSPTDKPKSKSRGPAQPIPLEPLPSNATPVDVIARVLTLCSDWAAAARELNQAWTAGDWRPDGSGVRLGAGRPGIEVPADVWAAGLEISAEGLRDAERLCRQHFKVPGSTCPLPAHRQPPVLVEAASCTPPEEEEEEEVCGNRPQHRRKYAAPLTSVLKASLQKRRQKGAPACTWDEPLVAVVAPIASMKGQDLWNTSAYTVQCDWCHNWAPQKTGQIWTPKDGQAPIWICVTCVHGAKEDE